VWNLPHDYLLGMACWLGLLLAAFYGLLAARRRLSRRHSPRIGWINMGLSLWIFLAGSTAVELYFALIYDQSDSFNMTNVSRKWFRRWIVKRELAFKNGRALQYRDDVEFPRARAHDQEHIVFIGDSFTFGHGVKRVEDRFSNRVRALLNEQAPGRSLVTNIADAGRELHWVLETVGELIEEDLPVDRLVYVLCLNDIETFDERHADLYRRMGAFAPQFFLFRDTYFFNMLYFRFQQATLPEVRGYYSFLADSYRGAPWNRMFARLRELSTTCREHDIAFNLVIFPFLHNLGSAYPFADAHLRVEEFCRREQVPCLDLRAVLEPHVVEGLMVNRFDAHPNERAHALAAEAIARWLSAAGGS
jgi:lysophospholipase L1-like esterase